MAEILHINRREQIADVAARLFREQGYTATSMRHLASEIGIEAASIYNHFSGKEEILQRICFRMAEEFMQEVQAVKMQGVPASQLLEEAITRHVKLIVRHLDEAYVFLHDWKCLSGEHLLRFSDMRSQYTQAFQDIIASGTRSGEFSIVDPQLTALTVLSAINWIHEWYRPDGRLSAEEVAANLSKMLINGIRKRN